jgi:hypothetical protein
MSHTDMTDRNCVRQIELEIVRGQAQQRRRPVTGPAFLIGSSSECDLVLSATQFAEVYACLFVHPSVVTARQVGEGPQMLHNRRPAGEAALRDGDRLVAGPFEFVVHILPASDIFAPGRAPLAQPPANRWRSAQLVDEPHALSDAAKLIHDIRAALEERPAIRRPA